MDIEIYEPEKDFQPDEGVAKNLKEEFTGFVFESELYTVLLVLLGVKQATDVEGFFDSEGEFQKFIDFLKSAGLNCYVDKNPSYTMAESFMGCFDDEHSEGIKSKVRESEIKSRIFITCEKYNEEFLTPIIQNQYGTKFHRRYGQFLEFEKQNIESFTYYRMPNWRKLLYRIKNGKPPKDLSDQEVFDKYGQDLSVKEKKIYSAFTFQKVCTREKFEEAWETAQERKKAVEDAGFDTDHFVELLADPQLLHED